MNIHRMKQQCSAAYRFSYTRLALNFYNYYETVGEAEVLTEELNLLFTEFQGILDAFIKGNTDITCLQKLRGQVTKIMEVITAYTDCFLIYEYVVNRLERNFIPSVTDTLSDKELAEEIMRFFTSSQDSAVMNSRIQQVVGELPVRFTKNKFFSLVQEGLSVYLGSQKKGFESMMYLLDTGSMLKLPSDMDTFYPKLYQMLLQFRQADYNQMTKEQYEELVEYLNLSSEILTHESGLYFMLQELINDLYVLYLTKEDAVVDLKEEAIRNKIFTVILNRLQEGDFGYYEEDDELLIHLEGKQESFYEKYLKYEVAGEPVDAADPAVQKRQMIEKLLSDSPFVSLEKELDTPDTVDREYFEQRLADFFGELGTLFADSPKKVVRAIMAKTLSALPIFFNSVEEIENYMIQSLENCTDSAEKETCIELIKELMISEYAMV